MTILIFEPESGTVVATKDWSVVSHGPDEISVYDARTSFLTTLKMDLDEFLALIADGGRIVDLRKLQEPK